MGIHRTAKAISGPRGSTERARRRSRRGACFAHVALMSPWSATGNRRDFVAASFSGIAAAAGLPPFRLAHQQDHPTLTLAVLSPASEQRDPARGGITLGVSEARHAATLFQKRLAVVSPLQGSDTDAADAARRSGVQALLCTDSRRAAGMSEACDRAGLVFINVLSSDDGMRRERCNRMTFHVAASDAMIKGATDYGSPRPGARVEMWDHRLERFGASQLNDRFRAAARGPMTSAAWAGWMAVKVVWEAFLRSPVATPEALASFLLDETTAFDGHKGMPLTFRRWDHQLRQPLYVVVPGSADVTEVPRASSPRMSMRELLDTIGDRNSGATCDG